MSTTDQIISRIRSPGFGVSGHHMSECVETQVVLFAKPDDYFLSRATRPRITRSGFPDDRK